MAANGAQRLISFTIFSSSLLFLVVAAIAHDQQLQEGLDPSLQPPSGNSVMLKTVTQNGKQVYKCSAKEWVVVGGSADLMLAGNPSVRVGEYQSTSHSPDLNRQQLGSGRSSDLPVATWKLENSAGDEAESGSKFSSVSGKEIFAIAASGRKSKISQALLQATSHELDGSATLISYIQLLFPEGGAPPEQAICELDASMVEVPFKAEFWFWRQDLSPPAVPASLSVGNGIAIQGLFGEGIIVYRYDGDRWRQMKAAATLYTLPGGIAAGTYLYNVQANEEAVRTTPPLQAKHSYLWELHDPINYRFQTDINFDHDPRLAQDVVPAHVVSASVDQHSLPWSLVTISTHSNLNNASGTLWAKASQIQIVSTRRGVPEINTNSLLIKGMTTRVPFSAIFWFY